MLLLCAPLHYICLNLPFFGDLLINGRLTLKMDPMKIACGCCLDSSDPRQGLRYGLLPTW